MKKEKEYKIKLPIYKTETQIIEQGSLPLSDNEISRDKLIDLLIDKIDKFNDNDLKSVQHKSRNKTKIKHIDTISYERISYAGDPAILLRITAYDTNFYDGYIETNKKINLKVKDKFGSNNHIVILYPHIFGVEKQKYHWIILIYEDPNKENKDVVTAVKLVLKKVLNLDTQHIKPTEFMDRIKKMGSVVPELVVKVNTVIYDDNDEADETNAYLIESVVKKVGTKRFINIPLEFIKNILSNKGKDYNKKIYKFVYGKRELKLEEILDEAKDIITQKAEEIFNMDSIVPEKDIKSNEIYKTDYIVKKTKDALYNYLTSYQND